MASTSQRQTRSETSHNRIHTADMAGPSFASTPPLRPDEEEQRLRSAWDLLSLCTANIPPQEPTPPFQSNKHQPLPVMMTRSRASLSHSSTCSSPSPSSHDDGTPPPRASRKRPRSDTSAQIVAPRRVVMADDEDSSSNNTDSSSQNTVPAGRRLRKTIVLPTPVDGLTKSSRGRKMPSVPTLNSGSDEGTAPEGALLVSTTGKGRTYVCTVPDCHKIFIRGEHLKRHVRSIHTHEKPHPCPHPDCGKSFSRRDNLSQHVQVHTRGGNPQ